MPKKNISIVKKQNKYQETLVNYLLNSLNDLIRLARPAGESCNPLIKEVALPKSKPPEVPKNAELSPNFKASS